MDPKPLGGNKSGPALLFVFSSCPSSPLHLLLHLITVAYKNVIGSRRASWRVISSIEQKGDADRQPLIQQYKAKLERELQDICDDILRIIDTELIPNSSSEEGKVFYYKMKGDYHRYLAEFQAGDARKTSAGAALESYAAASGIANSELPPTHPIRLGLALNFSVFYYEILNAPGALFLYGINFCDKHTAA